MSNLACCTGFAPPNTGVKVAPWAFWPVCRHLAEFSEPLMATKYEAVS
jgi:hypothetical protein